MVTGPGDLYKYRGIVSSWVTAAPWADPPRPAGNTAWHDGDTFACQVDMGGRHWWHVRVRCAGFDAPEINRLDTRQAAEVALAYAAQLVPLESFVYLDSHAFAASDNQDSFGRMLATVTLPDGRDLAFLMLAAAQAVPRSITDQLTERAWLP